MTKPLAAVRFALQCCIAFSLVVAEAAAQQATDENVLRGHLAPVLMGVFMPDGERAITASSDETAKLWDLQSHAEVRQYTGHTGPLFCLALSADGRTLVTGAQDNTLRVWDVPQTKPNFGLAGHEGAATGLALSSDGRSIASVGVDKRLRLWDATKLPTSTDPASISKQLAAQEHPLVAVAYRNDGNLIATADDHGRVTTWSPYLGQPQGQVEGVPVTSMAFHNNNQQLLVAGTDGVIRVWQLPLPAAVNTDTIVQPVKTLTVSTDKPVTDMVLYNGGAQVLSCSADGRIVMTDANSGQVVREFTGVAGTPQAIASRIDNQRVAVGTTDGKVFFWNAGNAELLQTLAVDGPVQAVAWSVDNQKLAVSTESNKIFIFGPPLPPQQSRPGSELVEHQQTATESPATRLVFDRDNRTIWASHASGHLAQWSYAAPTQIRQFNHGGAVYGVTTSRDGKTIVSCSADQTVRVWDNTTGQQRFQMNGHQGPVHAVALSPDESFVVSSGADRTLRLWDVVGGRQLKQLATLDETMYSVVVHPNGQLVAAAGADRKVYLFDLITGAVVRTLEGHTDYIHCVAFNAAGTRLLSYGYAGQLRIWEPSSCQLLMDEQIGRIGNYANYNADGSRILLSNGDGTARVFEVPSAAR